MKRLSTPILVAACGVVVAVMVASALATTPPTPTSLPLTTGIVVATCGTAPTSAAWTYAAGTQAPITISAGGALCVNQ